MNKNSIISSALARQVGYKVYLKKRSKNSYKILKKNNDIVCGVGPTQWKHILKLSID